jgi:hypothetical protein
MSGFMYEGCEPLFVVASYISLDVVVIARSLKTTSYALRISLSETVEHDVFKLKIKHNRSIVGKHYITYKGNAKSKIVACYSRMWLVNIF